MATTSGRTDTSGGVSGIFKSPKKNWGLEVVNLDGSPPADFFGNTKKSANGK